MQTELLYSKLEVTPQTSPGKLVEKIREFLDDQGDPLKVSNSINSKFGIPFEPNVKKAYLYTMVALEQDLFFSPTNIEKIMARANSCMQNITDLIGPGAFYVEESKPKDPIDSSGKVRHGSRRKIALEIYEQNQDKSEKEIIKMIAEQLDVTKQNAYTYVYLIKKDLQKTSGK